MQNVNNIEPGAVLKLESQMNKHWKNHPENHAQKCVDLVCLVKTFFNEIRHSNECSLANIGVDTVGDESSKVSIFILTQVI